MKILIIGSGGREHAMAWKIAQSPRCTKLYCAPGNPGIARHAECVQIAMGGDFAGLVAWCREQQIDLVAVGPERPLAEGVTDALLAAGFKVFGPTREGAQLESSKHFSKELMFEAGIPAGASRTFTDLKEALAYLETQPAATVIKASGLAEGKGVTVARTHEEARAALEAMMQDKVFGEAGTEVLIEEFLEGEEASLLAFTDGKVIKAMDTAQDHKPVFDGDEGPNTGGMGAYTPAPVASDAVIARTMDEIILPTIETLAKRGTPFKGVLFAGLMIGENGPKLIEYNTRFGDPECQVITLRLKEDLLPLLIATADGTLDQHTATWSDDVALTVVMAAKGYPGAYEKNTEIRGLEAAGKVEGVKVFHAGTKADGGRILATGGRVLNVTATGRTVAEARERAYKAVDLIDWPEGFCRRDIAWRAL